MSSHTLDVDQVDILVIGAGPAGLSTALSLHHHLFQRPNSRGGTQSSTSPKPRVLIVDALSQNQNESRATVIHARTLEVRTPPMYRIAASLTPGFIYLSSDTHICSYSASTPSHVPILSSLMAAPRRGHSLPLSLPRRVQAPSSLTQSAST